MSFGFHRIEILALSGAAVLLGAVFELVRRRKVKERYSLLWFCTCATVIALTLKREWLERLSSLIGVYSAPNSIFLVINGFMILILIHFSVVISQLLSQNQRLGQRIALLEAGLGEAIGDGSRLGDGGVDQDSRLKKAS